MSSAKAILEKKKKEAEAKKKKQPKANEEIRKLVSLEVITNTFLLNKWW